MTTEAPTGSPAAREGGSFERITVNLTQKSSDALAEAVRTTHDSKTDSVNRALQVYALLQRTQADGGALYLSEKTDAKLERLRLL